MDDLEGLGLDIESRIADRALLDEEPPEEPQEEPKAPRGPPAADCTAIEVQDVIEQLFFDAVDWSPVRVLG